MRNCPACNARRGVELESSYAWDGATANHPLGISLSLYLCAVCGMRYVDGDEASQEKFDAYYREQYVTDDHLFPQERFDRLAQYLRDLEVDSLVDIGGTDGRLIERLSSIKQTIAIGVGQEIEGGWDAVVMSHTLEHIYDMEAMFARIKNILSQNGWLVVEGPICFSNSPSQYDRHWQHINKFRPKDLDRLFERQGFSIVSHEMTYDYREYHVGRIAGWYATG